MQTTKTFAFSNKKNNKLMSSGKKKESEGFSLIEAVIALAIFLVVVLAAYTSITYAISYNTGNASRAQALSGLQQEVELLRSAKFTPQGTDDPLKGGVRVRPITTADGRAFTSTVTVDDNPFTPAIDPPNDDATLKQVTVTVVLASPSPGWQTAIPATVVLRRVRAN